MGLWHGLLASVWCVGYNLLFMLALVGSFVFIALLGWVFDSPPDFIKWVMAVVMSGLFIVFFLRGSNIDLEGDGGD
jgi:hypothetical protein